MKANYIHKDSITLIQDKLVKNELNQIELQYNALRQQKFNELLKENQALKKQLEETRKCLKDMYHINIENDKELDKLKTQQKEFIKYLEDKIKRKRLNATCTTTYNDYFIPLKVVLQKYKSIIGGD